MIVAAKPERLTIVVSRGQSRSPEKRELEQQIIDKASTLEGVDVLVIPHLYDLPKTSESFRRLEAIEGDIVLISWIYERAAHWVLDRNGVRGQPGEVQLGASDHGEDDDLEASKAPEADASGKSADAEQRMADQFPRPDRDIHCLDLKLANDAATFLAEIERIVGISPVDRASMGLPIVQREVAQIDEPTGRRWYPVIDYSRCTNCMECIDFCLFGVYGVDGVESILVEQPDNCRKGCPACSRVCPENAIIFPQHKAPAIAGASVAGDEGFKIDLSQLFGAPAKNEDPIEVAARERDEQLLLAGRNSIGVDEKLRERQRQRETGPKDALDQLIDSLDASNI
jgi:hypothetical protein